MKIATAMGVMPNAEKISVQQDAIVNVGDGLSIYLPTGMHSFDNKEDFISFIVKSAINVWEEAEKVKDENIADVKPSASDLYDNAEPLDLSKATEDDIKSKVDEIANREMDNDGWKPWMILKEVVGVDLINQPDMNFSTEQEINMDLKRKLGEVKEMPLFRRVTRSTKYKMFKKGE